MSRPNPALRRLYTEDGYYEIPDWASDEEVQALRDKYPGRFLKDPSLPGAAVEAVRRVPRALVGTTLSAARGIASLIPGETGEDTIDRWVDHIAAKNDVRYDDSFVADVGSAVGSTVPFLLAGMAGGVPGAMALGAASGVGEQSVRMDNARETGESVSPFEELLGLVGGAAIGTTEAFPVGRLLGKVAPKAVQAGASGALAKLSENAFFSALEQGVIEGVQEFSSGTAQNILAQMYEDSPILASPREGGLGFAAGALMDLATRGAYGGFGRVTRFKGMQAENAGRDALISHLMPNDIAATRQAINDTREQGVTPTPEMFQRPLDYVQQEDGTYSVVDTSTQEVLASAILDEATASSAMNSLQEADLSKSVLAGVLMKLDNQGMGEDPHAIHLGYITSHPNFTHVSIGSVRAYLDSVGKLAGHSVLGLKRGQFVPLSDVRDSLGEDFGDFADIVAQVAGTQVAHMNADKAASEMRTGVPQLSNISNNEATIKFFEGFRDATAADLRGEKVDLPRITKPEIRDFVRSRGYNVNEDLSNPEFKAIARALTGSDRLSAMADKRLLMARLAMLPVRRGAPSRGYALPDITPPTYSQSDYNGFLERLADGPVNKVDMRQEMNMAQPVFEQMIGHMRRAGIIKSSGNNYEYVDPATVAVNKNLEEGEALIAEANQSGAIQGIIERQLRAARAAKAEAEGITIEEANEELGTPEDGADSITEGARRIQSVYDHLLGLFRSMGVDMVEPGKSGAGPAVELRRDLQKILTQYSKFVAKGRPDLADPAGLFVDPLTGPATIMLDMGRVDPTGNLDPSEIARRLDPVAKYEFLRWLRNYDFFHQAEWDVLRRFVRKNTVSPAFNREASAQGKTWYDMASTELGSPTGPGSIEAISESAIAKAFEAYGLEQLGPDAAKGTANRLLSRANKGLQNVVGLGKEARLGAAMSIFHDIESGEVGRRGAGKSILNPEGEVRSLLMSERGLLKTEQARFKAISEDINADIRETGAEPVAQPLNEEQTAKLYAQRDQEIEETPEGFVPRVGSNASADALNVYYNATDPDAGTLGPQIRAKFGRGINQAPEPHQPNLIDPVRDVKTEGDDKTMLEKVYDSWHGRTALQDVGKIVTDMSLAIREGIADKRVRLDMLTDRARKHWLANGKVAEELFADWSAIRAVRMLDKSTGIMSANLRQGIPIYEEGLVRHEAIEVDGETYNGLFPILGILRGVDGLYYDKHAQRYMVSRRSRVIHEAAQKAKLELKRGGRRLSVSQTKALKETIAKGQRLPGGMDIASVQGWIDYYEKTPGFDPVLKFEKAYRAYNDGMIKFMADTGLISKEMAADWRGSDYVPFYVSHGLDAFPGLFGKKKSAARTAAAEIALEGNSESLDQDLITSIVENVERVTRDGLVNKAHAKVARDLLDLGEGGMTKDNRPESGSIKWLDNGNVLYMLPNDPELTQALIDPGADLFEGKLQSMAVVPARWLRESITRTPAFMGRNILRDTGSAYVTSGADFKVLVDTIKNLNEGVLMQAESLNIAMNPDFINDLGRYRKDVIKHIETMGETKHAVQRIWDKLGHYTRMSDASTRMVVYKDVLQKTGNEAEAAYQAEEIINYARRGGNIYWRVLTTMVPFLNARVQGVDVLWRSVRGKYTANPELDTVRDIQKRVFGRGAMIALMTGMYYLAVSDEDWYKNSRDEIKDDNWLVKLPGSDAVLHVPVPFEVGLLFKTLPEQLLRTQFEEGYDAGDAVAGFARGARQAGMFNPIPQAVAPLVQARFNRDQFSGNDIVPEYMADGMAALDQRDLSTNEAAVLMASIAEALNISPMKLEYVVNGYMGPMGSYAMAIADRIARTQPVRDAVETLPWVDLQDMPTATAETGMFDQLLSGSAAGTRQDLMTVRSVPLLGGLLKRPGGGYQEGFYELRTEVDKVVAAMNKARREGRVADVRATMNANKALLSLRGAVRSLDRYMTGWRTRRDRILMSDNYEPSQKREMIKDLEEERDVRLAVVPMLVQASRE